MPIIYRANIRKLENLINADLYGITAVEHSLGRSNIEVVDAMIEAGVKVIQYREKNKKARQMYEECILIREKTQAAGVTFIVNDFIDLALVVKADGVHIGQDDLPPIEVRRLVDSDMIIGLSTHSPKQADEAVKQAVVDYIGVGPIYKTQTKVDVCQPVGLEYLDYVVNNIKLPFVAIGGIKTHNVSIINKHGARTIAIVTEIVGAPDISAKIRAIRENIA